MLEIEFLPTKVILMPTKKSRSYRAGQHVHNFFAAIGSTVATGVTAAKDTVVDFAVGLKDGGEQPQPKKSKSEAAQTA